ncbi:hypothetical protein C8R43DRAFT_588230 [Mycena crocata]|nr:hypothetical protein C8R43DRAFT_588230 [Mycena crocata]
MSTAMDESSVFPSSNRTGDDRHLTPSEKFWRDHTPWLKNCGYILRPRYQPGWVPSWKGTGKMFITREDGIFLPAPAAMDARRIRDGVGVYLKMINLELYKFEHEIGTFFSSGSVAKDPLNHCMPILETLFVPDNDKIIIIVMPMLRTYSNPRFDTFGEAVDFFGQIFEGMKFMHDHNVAHRDCTGHNLMMDGSKMFPNGFHPQAQKRKPDFYSGRAKFYTRTQRPPKYYIIDFGFSRRYETRNPPPLITPIIGGDKTVPEFRISANGDPPEPCDPFPVDVYYLGNMILREFIEGDPGSPLDDDDGKKYGFEFMKALADDMTAEDPAKRPTMDEVIERFAVIRNSLSSWKLRSRVVKASGWPSLSRPLKHWLLRIGYILRRVPAIPDYRNSQ